ncbi:MAG TPA: sigma-70 family RNA polymerase sigma factor [Streptosporangiaceae bacterium]
MMISPGDTANRLGAAFDECWPAALRAAQSVLGSPAAAEDVAQDALVSTFEYLEHGNEIQSLRPFVARSAYRLALKRSQTSGRDSELPESLPSGQDVEAAALTSGALVWQALRGLSPAQRAAVVLHRVEDMTAQEVASSLDLSLSAAQKLIQRGESQLLDRCVELVGQRPGRPADCSVLARTIWDQVAGKLDADESDAVTSHVASCSYCRETRDQLVQARKAATLALLFPIHGLGSLSAVQTRLSGRLVGDRQRLGHRLGRRAKIGAPAAAIAAVAILAMLGAHFGWLSFPGHRATSGSSTSGAVIASARGTTAKLSIPDRLAMLNPVAGFDASIGSAVNDAGVVSGVSSKIVGNQFEVVATVWRPSRSGYHVQELPDLPNATLAGETLASGLTGMPTECICINDSGVVIGTAIRPNPSPIQPGRAASYETVPIYWQPDGHGGYAQPRVLTLPPLPSPYQIDVVADGISSIGTIVGHYGGNCDPASSNKVVVWSPASEGGYGTPQVITAANAGTVCQNAQVTGAAINKAGTVVAAVDGSSVVLVSLRAGRNRPLALHGLATSINDKGVLVGEQVVAGETHATEWTPFEGVYGPGSDLGSPGLGLAVSSAGTVLGSLSGAITLWNPSGPAAPLSYYLRTGAAWTSTQALGKAISTDGRLVLVNGYQAGHFNDFSAFRAFVVQIA